MIVYILLFLIFAFLGWVIDTTYSSIGSGKLKPSGYYKGIPLCPVYGFGGLIIYELFVILIQLPSYLVIPVTSIAVILFEYLAGKFCVDVLGERLWDYSNKKYNIGGHICLQNSCYWVIIVLGLYLIAKPFILDIDYFITDLSAALKPLDVFVLIPFGAFVYKITAKTKEKRLKNKVVKSQERLLQEIQKFGEEKKEKIMKEINRLKQEDKLGLYKDIDLPKRIDHKKLYKNLEKEIKKLTQENK